MTPYYSDDWLTILQGDVRDVLPTLPAASVDCIVTSPPYWGLRDYGTASWSGGDEECGHIEKHGARRDSPGGFHNSRNDRSGATQPNTQATVMPYKEICGKCGAVRQDSQIGLERTPEEYVANLVGVFRELRRVLKPSGTCWLILGDTFFGGAGGYDPKYEPDDDNPKSFGGTKGAPSREHQRQKRAAPPRHVTLKPKDLVGIPWRVAFALQADGWYLRSDIIWSKPNPMPESVTDRPTKAHEYLFLLTKSARYFFDADAVREPHGDSNVSRAIATESHGTTTSGVTVPGSTVYPDSPYVAQLMHRGLPGVGTTFGGWNPAGRNLRSVWTIATRPYPGAHFAVFPPELPERCIKAGSSERGVCPECGAPWERVVERDYAPRRDGGGSPAHSDLKGYSPTSVMRTNALASATTTGWRPSCRHYEAGYAGLPPLQPAVVLDPFAGSGTTGMVANRLSRRAVLIDLNASYLVQQMKRNAQVPLGLGA